MSKQKRKTRRWRYVITFETDTDFKEEVVSRVAEENFQRLGDILSSIKGKLNVKMEVIKL